MPNPAYKYMNNIYDLLTNFVDNIFKRAREHFCTQFPVFLLPINYLFAHI